MHLTRKTGLVRASISAVRLEVPQMGCQTCVIVLNLLTRETRKDFVARELRLLFAQNVDHASVR